MKTLLWALLCICTLNATAKTNQQDTYLQLFEPILLIGYQEALNDEDSKDNTPEFNTCVYTVTRKVSTPTILKQVMVNLNAKGLGKKVDEVTQFLSQTAERAEYAKNRQEFDQLLQAQKTKQAETLWINYYQDTAKRMPKTTADTMLLMLVAVGDIDEDAAFDEQAFKQELLRNPACTSLSKIE